MLSTIIQPYLRLPLDDLSFEGAEETVRAHDHWSFRHSEAILLLDTSEILSSHVGLADWAGCKVQELIVVLSDSGKELGDALVRPILSQPWQYVSQHITLGDGAVNV